MSICSAFDKIAIKCMFPIPGNIGNEIGGIMIYFPGRYYANFYGGAEVLILNLIRLWAKSGLSTGLVGNKEYSILPIIKREGLPVDFIPMDEIGEKVFTDDDLLILFVETEDLYRIKGNPRILLWNIMSYSLVREVSRDWNRPLAVLKSFLIKAHYRRLLLRLQTKNSLFFMDKNCAQIVINNHRLGIQPRYIPIPVAAGQMMYAVKDISAKERICITFLGRGDEPWKALCGIKLYSDLQDTGRNIDLHIITNRKELFEEGFGKFTGDSRVAVSYHFDLKEDSLWAFLVANSDIHFAMGTSALEAAKFGIPTILLDYSKSEFPSDYRYRWLYHSDCFTLGDDIEHHAFAGTLSMSEILAMNEDETREVSMKSFRYVEGNHSMHSASNSILGASPSARLNDFLLPRLLRITRKQFPFLKQLPEPGDSQE
jgi:hypothetical protein